MNSIDPFATSDKLDDTLLQVIVARLEARAKHVAFQKMLDDYLDALYIDRADEVLDMGCGTGVAARTIVRRSAFAGHVTGIDLSPYLLDAARRISDEEGHSQRITFRAGDTRNLPFASETFDNVVAHTLLSHVDDPQAVLKEAARVVKRGGMVGIFDGDYASLTFGHAVASRGKAYDEALVSAVVNNPHIMRQLPRLLPAAGLELVACFPYILAEVGEADFWLSAIEMFQGLVPRAGTMTVKDLDDWADSLRQDSENGVFFASSNFFTYIARRPVQ